jgi:hypothetical protein
MFGEYIYTTKELATISITVTQMSDIHVSLAFALGIQFRFFWFGNVIGNSTDKSQNF